MPPPAEASLGVRNTATRFGWLSIALHWIVVFMVIGQFVLAHLAEDAEEAHSLLGQIVWLGRHKSMGITILTLTVVRLVWRWLSPPPLPPAGMPNWQQVASRVTHAAFYVLLFALPLTGWAMSSAANFSVSYFHLFTLPDFVAPDDGLKKTLEVVHGTLAFALLSLTGLHVAAALMHHFYDRDTVLLRMLGRTRA